MSRARAAEGGSQSRGFARSWGSWASLLVLLTPALAFADDSPPVRVTCEVQAETTPWVGQRVTLVVTLYTKTSFDTAPSFDLPRLSGAVLLPPEDRPVLGTERVERVQYTTGRHELSLFVLRPGEATIPPFRVRFASAPRWGAPPEDRVLTTPELRVEAALPPGAEGLRTLICATSLEAEQAFEPQVDRATVGDAVTRRVTLKAEGVPGMVLPDALAAEVEGCAAYPDEPAVQDDRERGAFTGTRRDAVTYVFERPGGVELPTLVLRWWNLDSEQLETLRLPGASYAVAPAPVEATAPTAVAGHRHGWGERLGLLIVAALALIAAVTAVRHRGVEQASEATRFRELSAACAANDAPRALRAAYAWLSRDLGADSLAALAPDLPASVREELLAAATSGSPWRGAALEQTLDAIRRRRREARRAAAGPLAPLNPGG